MAGKVVYRIRRKSDGLYSGGGCRPGFSETGKVWRTLGQLKNHLNLMPYDDYDLEDLELVEMEYVERSACNLLTLYREQEEARIEKSRLHSLRQQKLQQEHELQQLQTLAQKLGKKIL